MKIHKSKSKTITRKAKLVFFKNKINRNRLWNNGYLTKNQKDWDIKYIIKQSWTFSCCFSFESFINSLTNHAFIHLDKKQLIQKSAFIFAFINLLPNETQQMYPNKKYWIHSSLANRFFWYAQNYRYVMNTVDMSEFYKYVNSKFCEKCPHLVNT